MRKGFTLVELSIVLVIIGLLIGGILTAQSMIETSKIGAQVRQFQQFDVAVSNFQENYRYLPGDHPDFDDGSVGSMSVWGDGNGIITGGAGLAVHTIGAEGFAFWGQLSQVQGTTPSIPFRSQAQWQGGPNNFLTSGANISSPPAKLGKKGNGLVVSALTCNSYVACASDQRNFYIIANKSNFGNPYGPNTDFWSGSAAQGTGNTTPSELLALDTKIDDGLADAGNVISGSSVAAPGNYPGPALSGATFCNSGSSYILTNSDYECMPYVRLGISSGVLK